MKRSAADIASTVRTKQEADICIDDVDHLLTAYYQTDTKDIENVLRNKISAKNAQLFMSILSEYGGDHTLFQAFLEKLHQQISSFSVFQLTIAFDPNDSTLDVLSLWVKTNISPLTVLDVVCNPHILGGAIISYKGIYKDFSLKRKLDELFNKKKPMSIV